MGKFSPNNFTWSDAVTSGNTLTTGVNCLKYQFLSFQPSAKAPERFGSSEEDLNAADCVPRVAATPPAEGSALKSITPANYY